MREKKFRAWDGEKYVYDEPGFCVLCRYTHEDCEQFTGLRDRNGKEIYEGDIVKFNVVGEDQPTHRNEIGVVKVGNLGDMGFGAWQHVYCKDIKIIGNIHENPELLT